MCDLLMENIRRYFVHRAVMVLSLTQGYLSLIIGRKYSVCVHVFCLKSESYEACNINSNGLFGLFTAYTRVFSVLCKSTVGRRSFWVTGWHIVARFIHTNTFDLMNQFTEKLQNATSKQRENIEIETFHMDIKSLKKLLG